VANSHVLDLVALEMVGNGLHATGADERERSGSGRRAAALYRKIERSHRVFTPVASYHRAGLP